MFWNSASATDCHVHGVARLTVKIERCACICATTSYVSEAARKEVSQGSPCCAGPITKIKGAVREETVNVTEFRCATWVALAEISGNMGDAMAIRHDSSQRRRWRMCDDQLVDGAGDIGNRGDVLRARRTAEGRFCLIWRREVPVPRS